MCTVTSKPGLMLAHKDDLLNDRFGMPQSSFAYSDLKLEFCTNCRIVQTIGELFFIQTLIRSPGVQDKPSYTRFLPRDMT